MGIVLNCCGEERAELKGIVYQTIYIPALSYGYENWVMTEE